MKTVKSLADLKQMALAHGASVEVGSTRYNTDGEKIAGIPRRPAAAPVTKTEPKPEPMPAPVVTVDTAPVAAAQERVAQMMAQALSSIPKPSAPVREWLFTVERDENGLLTGIRATAQP